MAYNIEEFNINNRTAYLSGVDLSLAENKDTLLPASCVSVNEKFKNISLLFLYIDKSNIINGYLDPGDGESIGKSIDNNTVICTTYFKVSPNCTYYIDMSDELLYTPYLYDTNKNFIKHLFWFEENVKTIRTTSDTEYLRLSFRHSLTTMDKYTFDYNIYIKDMLIDNVNMFNSFNCGKLSIIGDSISTYNLEGYKIDDYATYYPKGDVNDITKTYWYKFLHNCNGSLEVNASYSGSCVTNIRGEGFPTLCDRIPLLGNPDTILIALGVNDYRYNSPIGIFNPNEIESNLTEDTFYDAYTKGIKQILTLYPSAKIVCAIFDYMSLIRKCIIKRIAHYFNLMIIELKDYSTIDNIHPDSSGMFSISNSFCNMDIYQRMNNDFLKYGQMFHEISISVSNKETFLIEDDILTLNDSLYIYDVTDRIYIYPSNIEPIELGMADKEFGATVFIGYDKINKVLVSIVPPTVYEKDNENILLFAQVQKDSVGRYTVKTKSNAHSSLPTQFDGIFTTGSGRYNMNNIKKPGIYIRKDDTGTRGGILYVSVTNDIITQLYSEIGTNHKYQLNYRTFDNETQSWTAFDNILLKYELLNYPAMTLNGNIIFTNNSIKINGSLFYYFKYKRISLSGTFDLSLTTPITRLVLKTEDNVLFDAPVNNYFDEINNITIGFIVRDSSGNGNIKKFVSNIACQNIIYPTSDETTIDKYYNPSEIKYILHRGVRNEEIPENTTYSVMFAALYGIKYTECDVRYTSDGIGVVMHDTTINRTMYNSDLTTLSNNITIADNTYETLSQYVYKSTNEIYRTGIQKMTDYIDACAYWNICPIIQGSMSDSDLLYCMLKLGDNWICYGGNYQKVRNYSKNVLYLTSTEYETVDAMISAFNTIGGRVGMSRLASSKLTDDYIAACKNNNWEIMASFAYEKTGIPAAIRQGVTIVLSDNVGKDTNKILLSSLTGWSNFNHNGTITNSKLILSLNQSLTFNVKDKGNYKIVINYEGNGSITLPTYDNSGIFSMSSYPVEDKTFIYTFLYLEDNENTITLLNSNTENMQIERMFVFYEKD